MQRRTSNELASRARASTISKLTSHALSFQKLCRRANHPLFHITAPAQWINDPNGPIFYRGFYHLFYQLHPFSDRSGPKYWGHVRSRDLVKWEHLPIALAPSTDAGEAEVWSGCCTINGRGEPMIFYTSIAPGKSAQTHAEQWAAIGDKDLITWKKASANPVLSEALHSATKMYEWRDPFIFHDHNRTFLVTGGNLNQTKGGQAVVNIYEGQNDDLTQWKYRGVLFQLPDPKARTTECPNFFKLGNRWVLFVSPYGKVQYFVGDFDYKNCRFQARTNGLLDVGSNFYAPNTMQVPDGRRLVWGWVNGFESGKGWNGCLTVPRQLSLTRDGRLQQEPVPQLEKLRGKGEEWRNLRLSEAGEKLVLPNSNTFELESEVDLLSSQGVLLEFQSSAGNTKPLLIKISRGDAKSTEPALTLPVGAEESHLHVQLFIDRSVLEVFVNGLHCATKTISPPGHNTHLTIHPLGGDARAKKIQVWPISPIW